MQKPERKETNAEFVKSNKGFKDACEQAEVTPTTRQASKFRLKRGTAFRKGRNKS